MHRLLTLTACLICACASDPAVDTAQLHLELALTGAAPVDAGGAAFPLSTVQLHAASVDVYVPAGTDCRDVSGLAAESAQPRHHTVSCAATGERVRLHGPWAIDLASGATTPELPAISVPAGTITRVVVQLAPGAAAAGVVPSGSPLDGAAIAVTGKAPPGTNATFYGLRLAFEGDAPFESAGLVAPPDSDETLVARLDPAQWFIALPLATCAAAGELPYLNGVLQIADGEGPCQDVEAPVIDAIKASGALVSGD